MFEGTLSGDQSGRNDGQLPFDFVFPFLKSLDARNIRSEQAIEGTTDSPSASMDPTSKLFDEVYRSFIFAQHTFDKLDDEQLERAFQEAKILVASHLFGSELIPNVSIDPYGEFTFSHRSSAGYVDIGVRGENELSYHVRNDVDPGKTTFSDHDWKNYEVPRQLFDALHALRQHL